MHRAINYLSPVLLFSPVIFALQWTAMRHSSGPRSIETTTAHRYEDQENGSDRMRCTGMFSIKENLSLHWLDAMTSFPSCANATGQWIPHCQGSSQCVYQSIRLDRQSVYPSKKHTLLARDGKETFLVPDTSQTLHFIGEMVPIASCRCEHILMIEWQIFLKK